MKVFYRWTAISFLLILALFSIFSDQMVEAKVQKLVSTKIHINATPEVIFEAIRQYRDSAEHHRQLMSCDGRFATLKEEAFDVPIYGKVECLWQEQEFPFERIDYTLLSSDKFKSAFGSWILTPSADKKSTTLELKSFLDVGLHLPFADELTKMRVSHENKVRLEYIKNTAEIIAKSNFAHK